MIVKSYEIQKKILSYIKYNLFLLYGENYGLKKDIRESIKEIFNKPNDNLENISLYESNILENKENFYNTIYSESLFAKNRIITIYDGTDKILNLIEKISEDCPKNVFIVIFSGLLEKKSKLRNFFEKNEQILCVPCYPDNEKDLEIIIREEFKKNQLPLTREISNLLIEKSNNDRNNVRNEIKKITSFALNKNKLD